MRLFFRSAPMASLAVMAGGIASASDAGAPFQAFEYHGARGKRLPYRLFVPESIDSGQLYPLVIWLHDIFGAGSDNLRQITQSNRFAARLWTGPETQSRFPAFVLAPQCAQGRLWFNPISREPSQKLRLVLDLLDELKGEYPIDPDRVYLVGQSMGGWAVWALLEARPDLFAAGIAAAGAGRTSTADRIAHTSVWAFHGRWDVVVPAIESQRMVNAMRKAGGHPRYTEYPDLGHGNRCWERVFAHEPDIVTWLFAQRCNI